MKKPTSNSKLLLALCFVALLVGMSYSLSLKKLEDKMHHNAIDDEEETENNNMNEFAEDETTIADNNIEEEQQELDQSSAECTGGTAVMRNGYIYCLCKRNRYGFSCDNTFENPCKDSALYFPVDPLFAGDKSKSAQYFIQCEWSIPHIMKCPSSLVWNAVQSACYFKTDMPVEEEADSDSISSNGQEGEEEKETTVMKPLSVAKQQNAAEPSTPETIKVKKHEKKPIVKELIATEKIDHFNKISDDLDTNSFDEDNVDRLAQTMAEIAHDVIEPDEIQLECAGGSFYKPKEKEDYPYCICPSRRIGLTCGSSFKHPCAKQHGTYFPVDDAFTPDVTLSKSFFIQCDWHFPRLKKCGPFTIWDPITRVCILDDQSEEQEGQNNDEEFEE